MPVVRRAMPSDLAGLALLLQELGYPISERLLAVKLRRFASSASDAVFVVELGSQLVACIGCHWLELLHERGRLGRITLLIVSESARRSGLGGILIATAERYFLEQGCVRVEVTSGEHREAAHAFYESAGYEQLDRRFLKLLHPDKLASKSILDLD